MISFESFVQEDGIPIYLQIILFLKRGMVAGTIRAGDELPSRRLLSAMLGVNPNTVQKAYRMLEEEGLICSHAGAKSYASVTPEQMAQIRLDLLQNEARSLVEAMKQMDVTREEAIHMIEVLWEEEMP